MAVSDISTITFGSNTYNLKDPTKYVKPAGGIPENDLSSDLQTKLGKADTALQEHQSLAAYRTSASQDAIDAGKLNTSIKGVAGGVAELDANGKVPVAQCPIEEDVAQATADWLDEHVAQETGYVIDNSLTVTGAAADAKKTGDELNNLKSALGEYHVPITYIEGLYVDDGGGIGSKTNSRIGIIDLTTIPYNGYIRFQIIGNNNRCRLLLTSVDAADVQKGTAGDYFNYGNTTNSFTLSSAYSTAYKTAVICANFNQAPFASIEAYQLGGVGTSETINDIEKQLYGEPTVFTLTSTSKISRQFLHPFYAGNKYTITNKTNSNITFQTRLTKKGADIDNPLGSSMLGINNSVSFVCTADSLWFNSWCSTVGTIELYCLPKTIVEGNPSALEPQDIFNAEPYTGTYDWQTPVVAYGALFNGKQNVESFAFFTDLHTFGFADDNRNETRMENSFKRIQKVYNSTPCSFMVCGGDWLNNTTTKNEACYRLGYVKGISKNMFKDFYLVLGNHDTNHQGKTDSESTNYTGRLTNENIAAIMFRDTSTKKAYYSFDGANSKCYVLDTGIEHNTMLAYDWEQVDWLADQLKVDDADHAIIFLHIIIDDSSIQTNASNFGTLVEAYNGHTTVTMNSKVYDFTGCSGHVDFWLAGHMHQDSTGTLGGIPYILTATNAYNSDVPLIDLILVDYDERKVYLTRVGGTGTDRTISLAP